MDVLYMIGPGERNDELKYSIRSLRNFLHDKVVISGYRPEFLKDSILHIDLRKVKGETKHDHSTKVLYEACKDDRLSDEVLMMHDDMFIMEPLEHIDPMHLGPIWEMTYRHESIVPHVNALSEFAEDPLNYEAHVPMVINRHRMVEAIDWAREHIKYSKYNQRLPILKRSVYGNRERLGGTKIADVKVRNIRSNYREWSLLSTAPNMLKDRNHVGGWLRQNFPDQSPHERR